MATQHSRSAARLMMAPAVFLLLVWMLVPLSMTLWFSFRRFLPLRGGDQGFIWFENYSRFISSSSFWPAVQTTLVIVGDEDASLPVPCSREIAAAIPGASLVIVPGSGHLSSLEQPDAVTDAMMAFLDETQAGQ